MKHSPRRRAALAALTLITLGAGLALAGCSGPSASGTTNLTLWNRPSAFMKQIVKDFNASHSTIQVKLTEVPDAQFVSKVGASGRSNSGPDLIGFDDANSSLFAASHILADVTDRTKALSFYSDIAPGQIGTYQGAIYSVPEQGGSSVMYWNKDLFKKAGLDPSTAPKDFTEVVADAKKVAALGGGVQGFSMDGACGSCIAYKMLPIIWASGGNVLTAPGPKQKTTYASDPAVASVLKAYRDMWTSGVIAASDQTQDGTTQPDQFLAGKQGIFLAWPEFAKTATDAKLNIGEAPIPGMDGGTSSFNGGTNIGVSASSKHTDADWTFITWLLQKKQQQTIVKTGAAPVRTDMVTAEFKADYPGIAIAVEASKKGKLPDSVALNALMLDVDSPLVRLFQQTVFQGADVDQSLKTADSDSDALIKQAYDQIGG